MPMTDELSFGLPEALTADVVVVGAGASGMVAALSAAESGDSVILLEKSLKMGGALVSGRLAGRALAKTPVQISI